MKATKIIVLAVMVMTALICPEINAQKRITIPEGTNLNDIVPGAYFRPVSPKENVLLATSNVTGVASAVAGVAGVAFGTTALFYHIEYIENTQISRDMSGRGPANLQARQMYSTIAISCAGTAAALGATSLITKFMIRRKTIVKTATGGFVVEF